MDNPSEQLRRGFNWLGSATVATKVIDFVTILIVLLFLTKAQMGIASLVVAIGAVVESANGLGTGEALIQAKSVSKRQLDSIFWFAFVETALIGVLVMIAGPFIGSAYGIAGMWMYFCAVAVKQPIVGAAVVPLAMMNRDLQYERLAIISMCATLAAALTRLGLAVGGAGVWALVIGNASSGLYTLVGAYIAKPLRPRLRFHLRAIKPMLKFGINTAGSNMLQQLFRNVDFLLVGWFYGPANLAVYRVAFDIAMEPAVAVSRVIGRTIFPIMARVSAAREQLVHVLSWSLGRLFILVAPLIAAMMLIAVPLTTLLHDQQGHSYAAAALPLQLLAGAALLRVIFQLVFPLILASGRPVVAVFVSAATLLMLSAGILIVGFTFHAHMGLVVISAVWVAIYPLLLLWVGRYLRQRWGINIAEVSRALIVPGIAIALMVAVVEGLRLFVGETAPYLQIGIVVMVTMITYAGIFFYVRQPKEARL